MSDKERRINIKRNSIEFIDSTTQKNVLFEDKKQYFQPKKEARTDNFLTKLMFFAVVISFILIGLVFVLPLDKFVNQPQEPKAEVISENGEKPSFFNDFFSKKNKNELNIFRKRENILLLGVDSNGADSDPFEGTRSDTIMVLNIDTFSKDVNVLSIPRDSKVYIADGNGVDKINSAFAIGGVELTIKTIEEMFGIKIHHYIVVNYEGVKEIVKALGTVPVYVEKRMRYKDRTAKLYIDLEPGYQDLDYDKAEQFLRFRHDAIGDIGRMERQRWFVKGLGERLQSPDVITKIPSLIETVNKYVKTDMSIFDMSKYAGIAKNLNFDNIQVATLPGHPSQSTYASYWILEPDKVQKIIDKIIYRMDNHTEPIELRASVLYPAGAEVEFEELKAFLEEKKITVSCSRETKRHNAEIVIHTENVSAETTSAVKNMFPALKKSVISYSPENYLCGESDFTIVLPSSTKN